MYLFTRYSKKKTRLYFVKYFFSRSLLYFNLFSFLFFFVFITRCYFIFFDLSVYIRISILVVQSQQLNSIPNVTLFQVKVDYTYMPIHDDELSIKPNDIINVTRLVCLIFFFVVQKKNYQRFYF